MFDFHMVADRCLYRYSLSSSDTIASRDKLYWARRHQIPFLCVSREISDWPNTNSDLLQARTGTATVTPARTAALTRRNCLGEALRPEWGWGAWPLSRLSWLFLLLSWSLASPMSGLGEGSGPSQISPPAPDLAHFWASGSLNQKMMNLPGRWELYFAIFGFLPTLLSTDGWYKFHCVIQWRILLTIGDRLCVQLLNRSVIIMLYRVTLRPPPTPPPSQISKHCSVLLGPLWAMRNIWLRSMSALSPCSPGWRHPVFCIEKRMSGSLWAVWSTVWSIPALYDELW